MNHQVRPVRLNHPDGKHYLEFNWDGLCFVHQLVAGNDILQSYNDLDEAAWPLSPPIQQLSVEEINDHDVALGVGCAGTSHWSLSVEPIESGYQFEWACRTKVAPEKLLSTYRRMAADGSTDGDTKATATAWSLLPQGKTVSANRDGMTSLAPDQSLDSAGTFQWTYRAVFLTGDDV
ncbi:hypothetical protein [Rhodopirellula sp. MGV]|uniref:hypothetical protein n=1 Tax=Rhodopirellula sp. MGV TaxID=2023130 RepID=UPI000B95F957|nr:hypothetical protein [Rhodopirellula sp. MGV]OYP35445.1 hypothetical protein CGZ80_11410 [Rhodopirellula sp. MGV]PNY33885.1 hypothetical protein C2E31_26035 [Rhodopirellula baltica]